MIIHKRDYHHAEVTEPEVYASTLAGKLSDITIELPDHMVELTVEEARRLYLILGAALRGPCKPAPTAATLAEAEAQLSSMYEELLAGLRGRHPQAGEPSAPATVPTAE